MPRIELDIRRLIIQDVFNGKSLQEVAKLYDCSHVTVKKIKDKFMKTNDVKDLLKSGRPSKTSEREKRVLVMKSKKCPFMSAKYLKDECLFTSVK